MSVSAILIATGAELVCGATRDANSPLISELLAQRGVNVLRVELVGDSEPAIRAAIERAVAEAELVLVTGGLGPTEDDVTSLAAANAAGVELELDQGVLAGLRERFKLFGIEMPASNAKQAEIPSGAEILPNLAGTAPGFIATVQGARVAVLPGPPKECELMFREQALPRLERALGLGLPLQTRVLRVFGLTESGLSGLLRARPFDGLVSLGYKVDIPEVLLILRASGAEADQVLERCERHAAELIGKHLYSSGPARLPEVVTRALIERNKTLAAAESCTGGLISKLVTDLPGSSAVFLHGVVAYSNQSKIDLLGVPAALIEQHGAVSEPVALAMAQGIRLQAGSDYGLGITGLAGPGGGSPDKPVGTVWIALAAPDGVRAWHQRYPWDREWVRMVSAWAALERLRRHLFNIEGGWA